MADTGLVTIAGALVVAALLLSGTGATAPTLPSAPLTGVTVDDVSHLHRTIASLRHLPGRPWTREVLDVDHARPAGLGPYVDATRRLAKVSHVMAELVDSSALRHITKTQLAHRTSSYLDALGSDVDLWEIGKRGQRKLDRPAGGGRRQGASHLPAGARRGGRDRADVVREPRLR